MKSADWLVSRASLLTIESRGLLYIMVDSFDMMSRGPIFSQDFGLREALIISDARYFQLLDSHTSLSHQQVIRPFQPCVLGHKGHRNIALKYGPVQVDCPRWRTLAHTRQIWHLKTP